MAKQVIYQDLRSIAAVQARHEFWDRADLIPADLEVGDEVESVVDGGHGRLRWPAATGELSIVPRAYLRGAAPPGLSS